MDSGHTHVDHAPEEFAATMGYGARRYPSAAAFLDAHDERWVHELHAAYTELLDPARTVLGVGSGEGEHEVLLHLAGYRVVASDVVPGVLDVTTELFPGLGAASFDAFDPSPIACDDVLVGGLDFYFDDAAVGRLLRNLAGVAGPRGRVVLTLRYRANMVTWAIDNAILPVVAALQRRHGRRLERKAHGFRRSVRDIRRLAEPAGLRVGRVLHAAFAMEVARVAPVPGWLVALDRRAHALNSAVVVELVPSR